jgi:hypothetical protein
LQFLSQFFISDVPDEVAIQLKRQEFLISKCVEFESDDEEELKALDPNERASEFVAPPDEEDEWQCFRLQRKGIRRKRHNIEAYNAPNIPLQFYQPISSMDVDIQ